MNHPSLIPGICKIAGVSQTPKNEGLLHDMASEIEALYLSRRVGPGEAVCHKIELGKIALVKSPPLEVLISEKGITFVRNNRSGSGAFKEMHEGLFFSIHESTPESFDVAVLKMKEGPQNDREIEMLRLFEELKIAPKIIEDLQVAMNPNDPEKKTHVLIEPLVNGSTINAFLKLNPYCLEDVAFIVYCMLDILEKIHRSGYVHRDLKGDNFLVNAKMENGRRLISSILACDLGSLCKEGAPEARDVKFAGSPVNISPESAKRILEKKETSNLRPADIWALGVTFLNLLDSKQSRELKKAIFKRYTTPETLYKGLVEMHSKIEITAGAGPLEQLAVECLNPDPDARPTVYAVLESPLLRKPLIGSHLLLRAIADGRISIGEVFKNLLGIDLDTLYQDEAAKKEELYTQSKPLFPLPESPIMEVNFPSPVSQLPQIYSRGAATPYIGAGSSVVSSQNATPSIRSPATQISSVPPLPRLPRAPRVLPSL